MAIHSLHFAEPFFHIDYVTEESSRMIREKSLVINLAAREERDIRIAGDRIIPPLKGAVVAQMELTDIVRAIIIRDFESCDLADPETTAAIRTSWKSLYEVFGLERHKGLPYYKSPKFFIDEEGLHMELNLCYVSEGMVPSGPHRDHDRSFDEVHAQILGYGKMRIYDYEDKTTVRQELNMAPGIVHEKMYDQTGRYPWHEYQSVTPCVYCPIEIDRI